MDLPIRLKDILPGLPGSNPDPSAGVVVGNRLFFTVRNLTNGEELWSTDGTPAGTLLVKGINQGASGAVPSDLTAVGSRVFFQANDGASGSELWISDGTTAGTRQVADLRVGSAGSNPAGLRALGSQLLFWADDGSGKGRELWAADTSATVRLLREIHSGPGPGDPGAGRWAAVVGPATDQRMFFNANDGLVGSELWVTDGTTLGTRFVNDLNPGPYDSNVFSPTQVGGELFFMLNEQKLLSSNGTQAGTNLLWGFSNIGLRIGGVVGSKLFIDDIDLVGNEQLWAFDTSVQTPVLLKTFDPDPNGLTIPATRATLGNQFFFTAHTSAQGNELWVSDGTENGTRLVKDIHGGFAASNPRGFTVARGLLYFWADDGTHGVELWRSDGTAAGTSIVADLNPSAGNSQAGVIGNSGKVVGDKLVFSANDGTTGPELWALTLPDPTPPTLALSALAASRVEGGKGATPFTFQVTRSGNSSGLASVRWAVSATGSSPATASDFGSGSLPSGIVSFAAGQTRQTITVTVAGDLSKEGDETFRVGLSGATGATITTATANGTILNDDLIGDANRNRLVGTARAEFIDGRANLDTLTGGGAADVFGFRFGESKLSAPDAITDFAFGTDKIDLFAANGGTVPPPLRFSRAANNSTAKTLAALSTAVFADANGAQAGKQPLAANGAVLVRATNAAIAGTYLVINNSVAGRSDADDLMIKLNGFTGTLPAIGTVGVGTVFI
jgi:ELWxxDGT repeat protein